MQAVVVDPTKGFTWASGKQSPIYCDNRRTLSVPHVRTAIRNAFVRHIHAHHGDVDCIAGVATAGIAHGALVADALQLPYAYVRSKPKGHGMQNRIEGTVSHGAKVVVIEDLFSSGGSALDAARALRDEAGAEILACGAIFSYGFDIVRQRFQEADIPFFHLSDFETLLELDAITRAFDDQTIERLRSWYEAGF